MAIASIWKDYFVTLGTADTISFRIKVQDAQGQVIYSGKSHKKPGQTDNIIRINDICADYLTNALPALSQAEFSALSFPLNFVVEAYLSGSWTTKGQVQFINDWSCDNSYNPTTMGMSFPVTNRIDSRQWLVFTALNVSTITATLTFTDGTTAQVIIPIEIQADFNYDRFPDEGIFNTDFAISARSAGSGTAVFDLSAWDNVASVTINGKTWNVVTDCKEWVLYYVNAFGGWDSLLIEGNTIEMDTLTRHTREMEYDNSSILNRGRRNYVNEITKSYTMHTSWLSDSESYRMSHLLNSTEVYLYNINTGEMMPVVLTNTTTEYKTYKGNGGRLVNYTIEATIAQERVRR